MKILKFMEMSNEIYFWDTKFIERVFFKDIF